MIKKLYFGREVWTKCFAGWKISGHAAAMILHEYTLIMYDDSSFTPEQVKAVDVNGDGLINGTDAALVQRYYTLLSSANGKEFSSIEEWI